MINQAMKQHKTCQKLLEKQVNKLDKIELYKW